MNEWWDGLSAALRVHYAIGGISTAVVLLQLLANLVGLAPDADMEVGDADMGDAGAHPGGLHLISIRTVSAFFVGFGWGGVVAIEQGASPVLVTAVSVATGAVFVAVVFLLMRALAGLRHSGTLDYRNAVGQVGTVYLPIPAEGTAGGQVEVMIQGRQVVAQAQARPPGAIARGAKVRVVDVVGGTCLVVEPLGAA